MIGNDVKITGEQRVLNYHGRCHERNDLLSISARICEDFQLRERYEHAVAAMEPTRFQLEHHGLKRPSAPSPRTARQPSRGVPSGWDPSDVCTLRRIGYSPSTRVDRPEWAPPFGGRRNRVYAAPAISRNAPWRRSIYRRSPAFQPSLCLWIPPRSAKGTTHSLGLARALQSCHAQTEVGHAVQVPGPPIPQVPLSLAGYI